MRESSFESGEQSNQITLFCRKYNSIHCAANSVFPIPPSPSIEIKLERPKASLNLQSSSFLPVNILVGLGIFR